MGPSWTTSSRKADSEDGEGGEGAAGEFQEGDGQGSLHGGGGGMVTVHRGMQDIYTEIYDVGEGSEVGVGRRDTR